MWNRGPLSQFIDMWLICYKDISGWCEVNTHLKLSAPHLNPCYIEDL